MPICFNPPLTKGTRNLKLYPKYSPYTLDSLDRTFQYAGRCANLPQKRYFQPLRYRQTIAYCRLMKNYSRKLRKLEANRLTLLNGKACARDIEQCSGYKDVVQSKIIPYKKVKEQEIKRIWGAKSVSEIPEYKVVFRNIFRTGNSGRHWPVSPILSPGLVRTGERGCSSCGKRPRKNSPSPWVFGTPVRRRSARQLIASASVKGVEV